MFVHRRRRGSRDGFKKPHRILYVLMRSRERHRPRTRRFSPRRDYDVRQTTLSMVAALDLNFSVASNFAFNES